MSTQSEPPALDPVAPGETGGRATSEREPDITGAASDVLGARATPPRGFASLAPLRHRNYALLWSGGLVSIIGSWMQTVAVGALVIAHTGKATWAVLVAAGAFLPIGLLSPVGGALADRIPRRAALVTGNLAAGVVALVIAVLVADGRDGPGVLTLLVTAQGCVSALINPFQQAILPDLVPRHEFLAAVSLNSAQYNLGRVIGPALAGATVAAFGYPVAFVANAVSFLAVVVALAFIRLAPPPGRHERLGMAESLRLGFRAARREPGCRAAIGMIAVVGLLASPFIALVPAMAHRLSDGGARAIASATGLLTTAQGVGAVVGALAVPPLARQVHSRAGPPGEPHALAARARRLRLLADAVFRGGVARRRRAGLHRRAVGAVDGRPAAGARRIPRARAQLLPRGTRGVLSNRVAVAGADRRPHRPCMDDRRRGRPACGGPALCSFPEAEGVQGPGRTGGRGSSVSSRSR